MRHRYPSSYRPSLRYLSARLNPACPVREGDAILYFSTTRCCKDE
ncbi:hypothetical protein ACPOL_1883 [Acidisarcina polymorpha]|uniref:Uncharacterized protein n=1 Tax=Acidisarcina polymorpha TaxID=2211140 RepID=A0A2Z5FWF6_9BACT|nr:hypothetical protein ACPOL_1883 [Acidisarcina polymorpha]